MGGIVNLLATGYRAHELNIFNQKHEAIPYIKAAATSRLVPLLEDGLEWLLSPGGYGFDLWAVEAALELKRDYPQLKVSILTAYANVDEKWKDDRKLYYEELLRQVDHHASVSKQPYEGVWQLTARDSLLVRKSDAMLLFYDEEMGEGSPRYFKERALKRQETGDDYPLLTISAETVQSIADDARSAAFE